MEILVDNSPINFIKNKCDEKNKGFTLIEILLVVFIIVVLFLSVLSIHRISTIGIPKYEKTVEQPVKNIERYEGLKKL